MTNGSIMVSSHEIIISQTAFSEYNGYLTSLMLSSSLENISIMLSLKY